MRPDSCASIVGISLMFFGKANADRKDHRRQRLGWLRLAGLVGALAAVLLLASGADLLHTHANGSDEATCAICHAAHMPALSSVPLRALDALTIVAWIAPAETQISHTAPSFALPPPRAPPA